MAKLDFLGAPEGLKGKPYQIYRDWLEFNFYKDLCSYCLLSFPKSLQIEHHEPQKYAKDRVNDPTNLLLGCAWCNSGKSDYHPNHVERRRLHKDNSGHSVIDIREDDFSELFEISENGEILPKDGPQRARAVFNIAKLLRLDLPKYAEIRKRCLSYASACDGLIASNTPKSKAALDILVAECAERYLFYEAFDSPLSDALKGLINNYLKKNKPQFVA